MVNLFFSGKVTVTLSRPTDDCSMSTVESLRSGTELEGGSPDEMEYVLSCCKGLGWKETKEDLILHQ